MPAVVMKINTVEVLEYTYYSACLFFLLLCYHGGKSRNRSVLVCQLSGLSDILGIPVFHCEYKNVSPFTKPPCGLYQCSFNLQMSF